MHAGGRGVGSGGKGTGGGLGKGAGGGLGGEGAGGGLGGKGDGGGLLHVRWRRVVLDEAQAIKSHTSQIARAVFSLSAERRWVVTGTPVQNNLQELYALLHFLRVPGPAQSLAAWRKAVGGSGRLALLQRCLRPLMLRRTKATRDAQGNPILSLPERKHRTLTVPFSPEEEDFYTALHSRSKVQFDAYMAQGKALTNYATVLELLLRLRQACAHPFLAQSRGDAKASAAKLGRHLNKGGGAASTRTARVLAKLNGRARGGGGRDGGEACVPCASAAADTSERDECPICLEPPDDAVITTCAHTFCRECILAVIGHAKAVMCPICREPVSRDKVRTIPRANQFGFDAGADGRWLSSAKLDALLSELHLLREADRERAHEGRVAEEEGVGGNGVVGGRNGEGGEGDVSSGGVASAAEAIPPAPPLPSVTKSVVSSQWTSMLDLVAMAFEREALSNLPRLP